MAARAPRNRDAVSRQLRTKGQGRRDKKMGSRTPRIGRASGALAALARYCAPPSLQQSAQCESTWCESANGDRRRKARPEHTQSRPDLGFRVYPAVPAAPLRRCRCRPATHRRRWMRRERSCSSSGRRRPGCPPNWRRWPGVAGMGGGQRSLARQRAETPRLQLQVSPV